MYQIESILNLIENEELENVYSKGLFIDDDEILEFHNSLLRIYFVFETKILKIQRELTTDFEMKLSLIKKEHFKSEFKQDPEDYKVGIVSLLQMFLYEDRGKNFITSIDAFTTSDELYQLGIFKSIAFHIKDTCIFLDGYGMHGIEIGKKQELDLWYNTIMEADNDILLAFDKMKLKKYHWAKDNLSDTSV